MKLHTIINEIQRKFSSTNNERENLSGVYGVSSINDQFRKNRTTKTKINGKKKKS